MHKKMEKAFEQFCKICGTKTKPQERIINLKIRYEKPNAVTHVCCNRDVPTKTKNKKVRTQFFPNCSLRKTAIDMIRKG